MCNIPETVKHVTFDCPVASDALRKFTGFLKNKLNVKFSLTYNEVLLGMNSNQDTNRVPVRKRNVIDVCLILLKQKLILQRENKHYLSEDAVSKLICDRAKIETYNRKSYRKVTYNNAWECITI